MFYASVGFLRNVAGRGDYPMGRRMIKVVPMPWEDSTSILPP